MIIDIQKINKCLLMISMFIIKYRITEKAIKTSKINDLVEIANNFDVIAID